MKKFLALALAVLMLAAVMAACGTPAATSNPPATTTAATTTSAPPATGDTPPADPVDVDTMELTPLTVSVGGLTGDPMQNEMGKFLSEKFNITFTPVDLEGDKIRLLATADDLPDFFGVTLGDGFHTMLRQDGQIRSIPEDMLAKYPTEERIFRTGNNSKAIYDTTGEYWAFPMFNDIFEEQVTFWHALLTRGDWMRKVGVTENPTNMVDYADLLRKFTFDDPNGDGSKTFGIGGGLYGPAMYAWADYDHWIYEDGQWKFGQFTQGIREALIYWNTLYKEGVVDPDFASPSYDRDAMFVSDKIGSTARRYDEYGIRKFNKETWGVAHPDKDYLTDIVPLGGMAKDAASPRKWSANPNDPYGKAISSKVDDEKLERLLMFAEWLNSPEGMDFRSYGFLDVDYKITDGKAEVTLPEETPQLYQKYTTMGMCEIAGWGFGSAQPTKPLNPINPPEITAAWKNYLADVGQYNVPFDPSVPSISTPAKDQFNVDDWESIFYGIVSGTGDPGVEFDNYIQKLRDLYNYDAVLAEVNAIAPPPK